MPNSLKCRLKNLMHKGLLSEKDLRRISTDTDVVSELEKIKAEMQKEKCEKECLPHSIKKCNDSKSDRYWCECYFCLKVINKRISELKESNDEVQRLR